MTPETSISSPFTQLQNTENLRENPHIFFIVFFLSFAAAAILTPIIINLLYRLNMTVRHVVNKDEKNKDFVKIHGWKTGTPNMGGIMIWIIVPLGLILLNISGAFPEFKPLIWGFIIFGLYGFVDNFTVLLCKFNNKLRQLNDNFIFRIFKQLLVVFIGIALGYMMDELGFATYPNFDLESNFLVIGTFGVLLALSVTAFDIFDGADGLFSGSFIINFLGLAALLYLQGYDAILLPIFVILGTLVVFLYFNIPPARVWMGAPGAMPVGFALFFIAYITGNLIPFFIMTALQWAVLASSYLQIFAIRILKRKIFKIAPLHHHFESVGWPEYKVVMRFWLVSLMFTMAGVLVGLSR